ncbi:hypothetical protein CDV31_014797 [Fusarium ambrosium]|uniref:Uncharacterized protein n=1 Tax=Fusarium ambrosium TaxID=131363 RepID=A0A428STY1_9HYPO|nr:hypothetical protein CDV31_014797 [Fusarium ambrosium]
MRWVDIKLLPLLRSSSSTNPPLNQFADSIPLLQIIFITVAFSAFRSKTSSPFAMTNLWYLIETLKNLGAYEQLEVDYAAPSRETMKQVLIREQYQR